MSHQLYQDLYARIEGLQNENILLNRTINFLLENLEKVETFLGETDKEKTELKQTLDRMNKTLAAMEKDSVEYLKLYAAIQKEANKIENQKKILLENESDILLQLGEIAEEKKKIEEEREMIEQQSLEIAKNLGEIYMEKQTVEILNKQLEAKTIEANTARRQIQNLVTKIFPEEISEDMIQGKVNFQHLNVTVAFSDIKQFSSYVNANKPQDVAESLKRYFNDIDKILKTHNGWLVKYIGDSAMMLFGVPYLSKSHAMDSVLSALRIKEISKKHPWDTRFGINTGPVLVGDIGSANRPQYDALGDAVNVAARLERLGKEIGKDIIITVDTYVRVHKFFHTEIIGDIDLKGVGEHRLYEVKHLKGVMDNDIRVSKTSMLYKKYSSIEKEISQRLKELFPKIDFLRVESKDGSLNHSLAVAIFSVALKRELQMNNVNEEDLLVISGLHDIGKIFIKSSVLKKEELSQDEARTLQHIQEFTMTTMKNMNLYEDKIPLIQEFFSADLNVSPAARLVKIANRYDALVFPKFYIVESKSIEEAAVALKENLPCKETDAFIRLILPE